MKLARRRLPRFGRVWSEMISRSTTRLRIGFIIRGGISHHISAHGDWRMRSRRFLLAWVAVGVCASGSLAAQALYLGGVALTLRDRQNTTIADLNARLSRQTLESIHYMVYE